MNATMIRLNKVLDDEMNFYRDGLLTKAEALIAIKRAVDSEIDEFKKTLEGEQRDIQRELGKLSLP